MVWSIIKKWTWMLAHCERGGGSKAQPAQVIPPPTPPSVSQNASDLYAAQVRYNPELTAQAAQLQSQYGPQFAQSQYDIAAKYNPMYRALIEQQFPQIGLLSQQTTQQLGSPSGLTPEQQAAQDAIRQRAYDESARGIRSAANVGGNLYGGNAQLREDRARNELAQSFATQDIGLQDQRRQQALQQLAMLSQIAGFQVQQPNVPQYGQPVVPGGDNLYSALVANNSNFGVIPGTPAGPSWLASFNQGFRGI